MFIFLVFSLPYLFLGLYKAVAAGKIKVHPAMVAPIILVANETSKFVTGIM